MPDMRTYIWVLGYAGNAGVKKIVREKQSELRTFFKESILESILSGPDMEDKDLKELTGLEKKSIIPVNQCGILGTLYNISQEERMGMKIRIKDIPILQVDVEICEFFDINPYKLYSDMYVLLCEDLHLAKMWEERGLEAVCIGELMRGKERIIVDKLGKDYIQRVKKDEMDRVLNIRRE